MTLSTIISFEISYNAKKISSYVFFVMLIFQGVWYTIGVNDLYANNNIMLNAPAITYQNLSLMGIILFAVTAIISAGALARDLDSGAADPLYAMIGREKKYFCGKYMGAAGVNAAIVSGYPLGILLFPCLGIGEPGQFGPTPLGQLLHGFCLFTLPNLVFLVTTAVFWVVISRKAAVAYIGALLVFVLMMIAVSLRHDSAFPLAVQLLDPFGYCCVVAVTDKMDVTALNTAYLPLTNALLLNRMLWGGVTLLLFGISYRMFRFKRFVARPSKKGSPDDRITAGQIATPILRVSVSPDHGLKSCLMKTAGFAWLELKTLFRSAPFFFIMVTLFLMFLGYNFLWTSTYYLTTSHLPLTSAMTFIRIPMMLVIAVMLLILSGELLFKDRGAGVWQIVDAMPTPTWVLVGSRWLTLGAIAFMTSSLILGAGVISQWAMGFSDIQWGLYLKELYGARFGWVTSLHIICMAFFSGALFSHKVRGHIFSIAVFIFIVMSVDHRLIEQLRFAFPVVPGILGPRMFNYSEMNGYGVLDIALPWYAGAWSALAALFFVLTLLLWNRGVDRTWRERWGEIRKKFTGAAGAGWGTALLFCILAFAGFQYGIHENLMRKAGYRTDALEEAASAAYEKKYGAFRRVAPPKITDIDLRLDLFPENRRATYTARLKLENRSGAAMDTLHVDWDQKLVITRLASHDTTLEMIQSDPRFRHAIYRLGTPLSPGKALALSLEGTLAYPGFHQSDFQGDLTFNGTVLGMDLLPLFGYDRSRELTGNKERLRQGLALLDSRMDPAGNRYSQSNRFESIRSAAARWHLVVGTTGDQTVIAPGTGGETGQTEGRRYFEFTSEHPGPLNVKIISARLATRRFPCGRTPCTIFHDSRHTYNLAVFQQAAQQAMKWLSKALGPYPYTHLRIVEKPFYGEDFLTFANVTAVSETRGWTADIRAPADAQYIHYTLARALCRQWLDRLVTPADVEGADLLILAVAEFYALCFMTDTFGHPETVKWLNENFVTYQKGRAKEAIGEKCLVRADNAPYLSRAKGGLALHAICRRAGEKRFHRWLRGWLTGSNASGPFMTALDFYEDLLRELPDALRPFAREWMEQRVRYRISLMDTTLKEGTLGLTVTAVKKEADTTGEREVGFTAPFEIGLLNEKGQIFSVLPVDLKSGTHTWELRPEAQPAGVVIDPNYWYLIENRQKCITHF